MGRLEGKVAVVTGASKGIGRATAIAFAKEGASVVLASRSCPKYETELGTMTTDEYIRAFGGKACFVSFDASDRNSIKNVVEEAVKTFGKIDIMFNCAGIYTDPGYMHEKDDKDFEDTIEIDLKSVWYGCKYALAEMVKQGWGGKVINVASLNGLHSSNKQADYCTAKGGVVNLTRALAYDYGPFNINVNCICPGWTETDMVAKFNKNLPAYRAGLPLRRVCTPEDIANVAVFLCSEDARQITGQPIVVDGGADVLPPRPVTQLM